MTEEEYKAWQIEILKECYRVLKEDGSIFYNHKNRIVKGKGCISTPYEWLLKTPLLIRQEIVWDRLATPNFNKCRFSRLLREYIGSPRLQSHGLM